VATFARARGLVSPKYAINKPTCYKCYRTHKGKLSFPATPSK